jgi:hypothetical protein
MCNLHGGGATTAGAVLAGSTLCDASTKSATGSRCSRDSYAPRYELMLVSAQKVCDTLTLTGPLLCCMRLGSLRGWLQKICQIPLLPVYVAQSGFGKSAPHIFSA